MLILSFIVRWDLGFSPFSPDHLRNGACWSQAYILGFNPKPKTLNPGLLCRPPPPPGLPSPTVHDTASTCNNNLRKVLRALNLVLLQEDTSCRPSMEDRQV